jgi:hypothetical protein
MSPRLSIKLFILFVNFFLAYLIHFCPIHRSGFNLEMATN